MVTHHVYGSGAVGVALHYLLEGSGANVKLYGRENKEISFSVTSKPIVQKVPVVRDLLVESGDYIWVCVKAYDLHEVLKYLIDSGSSKCHVIVTSNGYIEEVLALFNNEFLSINRASIFFGANRSSDGGTVELHGESWSVQLPSSILKYEGYPNSRYFSYVENFYEVIAKKWVINVLLNSLSVVYKAGTNGDLLKVDRKKVSKLFDEAVVLAENAFLGDQKLSKPFELSVIYDSIDNFSNNQNSMYADVLNRRRTEVSFLTGVVENFDGFPELTNLHKQVLLNLSC